MIIYTSSDQEHRAWRAIEKRCASSMPLKAMGRARDREKSQRVSDTCSERFVFVLKASHGGIIPHHTIPLAMIAREI